MTRLVRIGAGLMMMAIGAAMTVGGGSPAQAALHPNPVISITPAQQTLPIATGSVTLQVSVQGTFNTSAYGIELMYDPYVLKFDSAQNGTLVTTDSIPALQCQPAQDREVNIALDPQHAGLRLAGFGCTAVGAGDSSPTVDGSGLLMTFVFKLVGGGTTALVPTKYDLLTPLSNNVCEKPNKSDPDAPCDAVVPPQASVTVDGPVLPRPTVAPGSTPTTQPAPFQTPTAPAGISNGTTPAAGTTASGSSTSGGSTTSGGTSSTGGSTSSADGSAAAGGTLGDSTQPGSSGASNATGGSRSNSGANGTNSAGVGKFGSGPDSSASSNADTYRTGAIAVATLGFILIVAGIWRDRRFARQLVKGRR